MIVRFLYGFPGHLGASTQAILNSNFVASTCNAQCDNAISDSHKERPHAKFVYKPMFRLFLHFFPVTMFESVHSRNCLQDLENGLVLSPRALGMLGQLLAKDV